MKLKVIIILLVTISTTAYSQKTEYSWEIDKPILSKGKPGSFDETAVKDPSVVFYNNRWHIFYTAGGLGEYTTGYVSAKKLEKLNDVRRYELKQIRGKERYGCAPQVFYYEPQKLWYLIFQNRDSNYQPMYSSTKTIDKPESWSEPKPLLEKDEKTKWIDFWIIGDEKQMYLFYTRAHKGVMGRTCSFDDFPNNWEKPQKVFDNVHEAVHIYKDLDTEKYHMIYEINTNNIRSFGLAAANDLLGDWEKITDLYATPDNIYFPKKVQAWTEMVSHGEIIRNGYNQKMEYNSKNCSWIIQGLLNKHLHLEYTKLPWSLGVMKCKNIKNKKNRK